MNMRWENLDLQFPQSVSFLLCVSFEIVLVKPHLLSNAYLKERPSVSTVEKNSLLALLRNDKTVFIGDLGAFKRQFSLRVIFISGAQFGYSLQIQLHSTWVPQIQTHAFGLTFFE